MKLLSDYHFRQYLYGIATAVLLVLSGYGFVSAAEQDNWLQLTAAVLNVGGAGATALAARKAKPAATDKQEETPLFYNDPYLGNHGTLGDPNEDQVDGRL